MKKIIYIFFTVILFSCSSSKTTVQGNVSGFLIKKITNKNSWHIIYAQKQDSLYKIVVEKKNVKSKNCEKITVGQYYDFELLSRRENIPVIGGIKLRPANYLDVESSAYVKEGIECYLYDNKTEICTEPKKRIYDIYYTSDLNGLCYDPKKEKN